MIWLKRLAYAAAGSALVVLLAVSWLMHTEAAARWLLNTATRASDGAFVYADSNGTLAGGLAIANPRFSQPGIEIVAQALAFSVEPEWLSLTLELREAAVDELTIDRTTEPAAPATPAGTGSDVEELLEGLALPVVLRLDDFRVNGARFVENDRIVFEADAVSATASWGRRLVVESFSIRSNLLEATADGRLVLSAPFDTELRAELTAQPALTGLDTALAASLEATGSLEALEAEVRIDPWNARVTAGLEQLLDEPVFELDGRAELIRWPLSETDAVRIESLSAAAEGTAGEYRFTLDSRLGYLAGARTESFVISASGTGSTAALRLDPAVVEHAAGRLDIVGVYTMPAAFRGTVGLADGTLAHWLDGWPQEQALNARFELDANPERVSIDNGRIELDGTPAEAVFSANIDVAQESLSANVEWTELDWPLGAEAPQLESARGGLELDGRLDDWQARAGLTLEAPGVAAGELGVAASGDRGSARLDIVEGQVLGGSIAGQSAVNWRDGVSWESSLVLAELKTGALFPSWPGHVTADIEASGTAAPLAFTLDVKNLDGELIERRLNGGGWLEWQPDDIQAREFRFEHGSSRLAVNGSPQAAEGLEFDVEVDELAVYNRHAAGGLRASGRLSRAEGSASPLPWQVELSADSRELSWDQLLLEDLVLSVSPALNGQVELRATATAGSLADVPFAALQLEAGVGRQAQALSMRLEPLGNAVSLSISGAFDDPADPYSSPWRGRLDVLDILSGEARAGLRQPAVVEFSTARAEIRDFCLSGGSGSEFCAGLTWQENGAFELAARGEDVPLNAVNAWLPSDFVFEQRMSGSLDWRRAGSGELSGRAALDTTPGRIVSRIDEERDLETGEGRFAFDVENGELLSAELTLPLPGTGYVVGDLALDDITAGRSSDVSGQLNVQLRDLDLFNVLLPDVRGASGELAAEFVLGGSLGEPELRGVGRLDNGALSYAPLGLDLEDLALEATVSGLRQLELEGGFRAGDGRGTINAVGESSGIDDWTLRADVRGEQLTLVDLPDVRAIANLGIEIDYRRNNLDIQGNVEIPSASILPANLANTPVSESDDVVIVAGSLPGADDTAGPASELAVHGLLKLSLGPDVRVKLDLAEASVTGSTDFTWSGDPLPTGSGRYDVRGNVEAFGQVLDISEGAIRFPDVPADDPLLRVRATREIYGNSEIKRAGVLLSGSAKQPRIEAYTDPPTTEERALALLVTGNDFNVEEGVGSVDFGTYIAPRLFLSYGVGVFDRENVISARYDLNEGFGIRATSGAKESGFDLTYRIER